MLHLTQKLLTRSPLLYRASLSLFSTAAQDLNDTVIVTKSCAKASDLLLITD
jgi:hypothetical protein